MDKLSEHAIRMLEIVDANDIPAIGNKQFRDIAQAIYDLILQVQMPKIIDHKTELQTDYTPDCPFCIKYGTEDCLKSNCIHYKTYKTEPQTCDTCKYGKDKHRYAHICNECGVGINNYEPKTEPNGDNLSPLDEPQTMYYPQADGITPSVILPKTKPQTVIDKARADIAEWSLWSKTYEAMYNDKPQTERESE